MEVIRNGMTAGVSAVAPGVWFPRGRTDVATRTSMSVYESIGSIEEWRARTSLVGASRSIFPQGAGRAMAEYLRCSDPFYLCSCGNAEPSRKEQGH